MIKTLQKKFTTTAMIAVTILLLVLLGGINIVNAWSSAKQTDSLLHFLTETEASPMRQRPFDKRGGGFFAPPFDEDTKMSAVYFTAQTNGAGEVIRVDTRRIATVTEEEARAYVASAAAKGKTDGKIDRFRYRATPLAEGEGTVYVFLDDLDKWYSIARIAVLSLLAGLVCWGLMLLLIVLLSKKAIRPIAESIERQKQFVTDAGHELKTPIAIILANTDALELHTGESKWSRNIREQTTRLTRLMQNLLTLARLEEPKKATDIAELSLSELLADTLDMFREPMEQRGLTLAENVAADVAVRASREQITRLLSTLFDNAVRYADENTEVQVSLTGGTAARCSRCRIRAARFPPAHLKSSLTASFAGMRPATAAAAATASDFRQRKRSPSKTAAASPQSTSPPTRSALRSNCKKYRKKGKTL